MTFKAERKPINTLPENNSKSWLEVLYRPISSELPRVEEKVASACSVIEAAGSGAPLLQLGGKRIRPALVLLSSLFGSGPSPEVIRLAAAVEILHLATLVHDDLIDCSASRRGKPTVNRLRGNNAAILTGDYLYALFLEHTAGFDKPILASLAGSLQKMVKAELLQQQLLYDCNISEKDYLARTYLKSGAFLSCCCRIGAEFAGAPEKVRRSLERYGWFMGISFQIKDDILDFQGDASNLGKPVAQDLKQGVLTLPVIHALKNSPGRHELRALIEKKELTAAALKFILRELMEGSSLSYSVRMAERYAHLAGCALTALPDNAARNSLKSLLKFVITREL